MATLQKCVHNRPRHRHRQQQQQQQKQKQQQQQLRQQECHNAADNITKASVTASQGSHNHLLFLNQYQAEEQTNLKQRTVNVGGAGGDTSTTTATANLFCHRQVHHQRVNHRNEYTTKTAASSVQTESQQQQQQEQKQRRRRIYRNTVNSGRLNWSCTAYNWHFDSTLCIMITMFVVATIVVSGNSVFAAQRDSLRIKDTKGLGNNANAILNSAVSLSTGNAGNGNGNAVNSDDDNDNDNDDGNGNGDGDDGNGYGNGNAIGIGGSAPAGTTTDLNQSQKHNQTQSSDAATTTTIMSSGATSKLGSSSSSSSSSMSMSIASGSLQKVNSLSGNGGSIPSGNSGINRNAIETLEDTRSGPYFDKAASKNVTALLGKTAYLNCRVKNLGNKTMLLQVSWVRHRDIHLLTVGRYTYTSDQRFRAIHQPQTEDWILQIKYPQHRDSGIYECQVSTTPHMSHYIHLNVVEPSTEIIGAPDLYIESGSTINLTCVILNSPEPPAYIFWNHNNAIINYDSPRGGVSVVTNKGETTTSFLLIKTARPTDSGLYQCNPSNAKPKSVTVHVLNGEFPAAMQRAGLTHHRMSQSHYLLVYLSLYLFTLAYVGRYMRLSPQSQQLQPQLPLSIEKIDCKSQATSDKEPTQAVRCLSI